MGDYTKSERETVIRFDDETGEAIICTFQRHIQRKLEAMAADRPGDVIIKRTYPDNDGLIVTVPKRWIKIRPSRQMTDEQRETAGDLLRSRLIKPKV